MTFRRTVDDAVRSAAAGGQSYDAIMCDISTVLGCLIAAGSPHRAWRMDRVKASMAVIAGVLDKQEADHGG